MSRRRPRPDWAYPGLALAHEMDRRAQALGLTQAATAKRLGIAAPYYNLLLNGRRPWASLERGTLLAIADFLDLPLITVLMLAEVLVPDDFFPRLGAEQTLAAAYDCIQRDRRFAGAMPSRESWQRTPRDVRIFCAALAEQLMGRQLLDKASILDIQYHHH